MSEEEIEELIKDLILAYAGGEKGENGWLIVGQANKEKAESIVRKHFGQSKSKDYILKLKNENSLLKTKLEIYKQIISKSNFKAMIIQHKDE